jgi:acyl-CoA dehydrogenase
MPQTMEVDFDFEEERAAFRTTADAFVQREIVSLLPQTRLEMSCPRAVFERAAEMGLLGVAAPAWCGGSGLTDPRFGELVVDAAAQASAPGIGLAIGLHSNVAVPTVISGYDGPSKNDLLAGMANGSTLVAIAGHTSAISAQDCDAGLELSGTARGVVNAANADKYLVIADTADAGSRVVLVDAPAARVLPAAEVLGARDAGARDVAFDGIRVGPEMILAGGSQAADNVLADCALVLSAVSIAGARAAVSNTVAYVQERKVFGRTVAEFENTRAVLAGLWAELLVTANYHDECAKRRGLRGVRLAEAAAALLRSFAVYDRAVDQGMQLHGGYGYMLEYPIAQAFADARFIGLTAEEMRGLRPALLADLGL